MKPPPTTIPDTDYQNLLGYYAGFSSRLIAFVIDASVISLTIIFAGWFINSTSDMLQFRPLINLLFDELPQLEDISDLIFSLITTGLIGTLFVIAYHVLFVSFTGQTPGKALLGLRVVTLHGGKMKLWRSTLRYIGYFISGIPLGLGFFWILIDNRRMAWHDQLARTCVIYTWPARPDERFLAQSLHSLRSRREAILKLRDSREQLANENPDSWRIESITRLIREMSDQEKDDQV